MQDKRIEKINKIKQTLAETRRRRLSQRCLVYQFKLNTSKMNKKDLQTLRFMFTQCKWVYNYLLSDDVDIFSFDSKNRLIYSLDKNGNKIKQILTIPTKMVQDVRNMLIQNLKSLKAKKSKNKNGRLKFKSEYNSIELSQYGITHYIKNNKVKILGIKNHIRVHGLDQLQEDLELTSAKLIKKSNGYYIYLSCFQNKNLIMNNKLIKEVGLDYGIKTNITTSDGEKFNICIEESERLKGLQKKLSRQQKGSNNRYKTIQKIRREYEKLSNKKKDKCNKLVSYLCAKYSVIYMQDEMIRNWHKGLFGKQVQHSCMGLIKAKLIAQPNTYVIDRSFPSTKLCYNCGTLHKSITLADREFICSTCGFSEDRDIKAAKTLLFVGQCKNTYTPTGHRSTNVEKMSDFLSSLECKKHFSMKHEVNYM